MVDKTHNQYYLVLYRSSNFLIFLKNEIEVNRLIFLFYVEIWYDKRKLLWYHTTNEMFTNTFVRMFNTKIVHTTHLLCIYQVRMPKFNSAWNTMHVAGDRNCHATFLTKRINYLWISFSSTLGILALKINQISKGKQILLYIFI